MKNKIINIIFVSILVIQLIYLNIFFVIKQGYHSDEVWNYGFANSYYVKDLSYDNNGEFLLNKWNSSKLFKDYITVDHEHRFSYDAIIRNCNMDFNPPFQFMVLHTICSLFPDVFSWYFCFIINLVSFLITQIFLFKITSSITENKYVGICATILYGFCVGCMDIAIFMRIYALGVAFLSIFTYYSHEIYKNKKNINLFKNLIICYISLFLGAYTLHVFLIPAFSIVFLYSVYYLFSKRIKCFFSYGFACLSSVILSITAYPKVFYNLGIITNESNSEGMSYALTKYPLPMQLRLYAFQYTRDLFGIHISPLPNPYLEWFLIGLVCTIVLITPFCFVFRKEEWFKKIIKWLKNKIIEIFNKIKFFNYTIFVLLVSSLFVWFIAAWKTSWYYMNTFANRYIFIGYPLAAAFGVVTFYYIIKLISNNIRASFIITLLLSIPLPIFSHFVSQSHAYLFLHETEGITLDQIEEDANCIIMLDLDWVIVCFAPKLYNTNAYFATDIVNYKNGKYFEEIDYNHPYYVILDQQYVLTWDLDEEDIDDHNLMMLAGERASYYIKEEDMLDIYESNENVDYLEYVGKDSIMKRKYKIYKVHFK